MRIGLAVVAPVLTLADYARASLVCLAPLPELEGQLDWSRAPI